MPTTYAANSPRNRYTNVKAKVDTSDPNPAHKLSRTLSDLTIKEGKQINPRFTAATTPRSGTPASVTPKHGQSFSRIRGERATGGRSPFAKERAASELISREKMPSMKRGMANQNSPFRKREVRAPAVQTRNARSADILRETKAEDAGEVSDKSAPRRPLVSQAFSEAPDITIEENEEEEKSGDVGVCGMEVSNNKTETTVVLKHILALGNNSATEPHSQSSSPVADDLMIVEEDEPEFYESEDKVKAPSEIPRSYNLPHLIPSLIVTSEDEELVETVVLEARKLESTGGSLKENATNLWSKLGDFEEEEEEEDEINMSTHL